ncbi:MAG: insulinase family protein [Clostridiales bacterium]|nr:insulinase family protein [Clostridiales bacterium]
MKTVTSSILGEKYYEINHNSGLKIFVMPKENYKSTYAVFGTKYGSIDNCFKENESADFAPVPEGIAHFLEHKLFENEEIDAFERYAKTGASANAYTSFDKTCYLFQCSDKFADNLKILLDFVTHPYFTEKTVQKEQGIIGQEITMYYDVPSWMSTFYLLRCLYKNHPVKIDIAGTCASIAKITDKLLYKCYNTFYNLNNMALAVVGNVNVDEVVAICDEMLEKSPDFTAVRAFDKEPDEIVKPYDEYCLDVGIPVFSFGYKEKCENPVQSLEKLCEVEVLLEIIAGKTSPLYTNLLSDGLINNSFSKEYFVGHGYEAVLFDGESNSPETVAAEIKKEIARLKKDGIDSAVFECARRSIYGGEIMAYNDIDELANMFVGDYFQGFKPFDVIETYRNLKKEDVEKHLDSMLREDYSALAVVKKAK